jgi:DNA modification methylase
MSVQTVKLSDVKSNPNNPRLIKNDKFEKLVQSLKDFPEMAKVRPIVVNQDFVVLGGNMRLKAMKEAGWKEVPIEVVDWSEQQQKEFIIKDNVGFGEWEWDILANEWEAADLEKWGLDVPGFVEEAEAEEDDFDVPDGGIETDIVLGDLFEIGEHRLLCGDSTDSDAVARLMNGDKADMVFTDPPYNVTNNKWDKFKNDDFINFLNEITSNMFLSMSENSCGYFCLNWRFIANYKLILDSYGTIINWIIWQHPSRGANFKFYTPSHQDILLYRKGENYYFESEQILEEYSQSSIERDKYNKKQYVLEKDGKTPSDVWYFPQVRGNSHENVEHPTQKPIDLICRAILASCAKNGLVLDAFLGSGSTMVAAHQLNRKCYGMELDPKYCQVIVDRMLKLDPNLVIKRNGEAYLKTDVKQTQDGISA